MRQDLIEKIEPDEVPYLDPDAPKAAEPASRMPVSRRIGRAGRHAIRRRSSRRRLRPTASIPMLVRALIQVESRLPAEGPLAARARWG